MADTNHELQRLLKAAGRAAHDTDGIPPFGFETRVLAQWRETSLPSSSTSLYRQAVLVSLGLACLALVFMLQDWRAFRERDDWQSHALRVADSELQRHFQ